MRKAKAIRNFNNELTNIIDIHIHNIKEEYESIILEEKNKLLEKIAEGENLNIDQLKSKYLKKKGIKVENLEEPYDELLDKVIYENKVYYFENKENGKVYDINFGIVGRYKNSKIVFN